MGVVYKAKDTNLDRTVALKFLPSHLTRPEKDKQRFIREAKAAAALNHPNICTIHSVEEHERQHFISMEYIDGQTLHEKLDSENITLDEALEYAIGIAEALAEAHEKGIVHRDIKPGNIMVDSKGRIKVMDFGLAKLVDSTPITQTGTTLGTMAYMSPEQIQGRPVDHRADLFSFGVLLFEMLTGQRPFGGQYDAALSYAIVNEEPLKLSDLLPTVPLKLTLLINRLLEKDPAKRYSSTKDLTGELKTCLDQSPDSIKASKVTQSITSHTVTGDSYSSGSTSIFTNFPSLHSRGGMLSLAGVVIVLALIGYWLLPISSSTSPPTDNKIAVLPLESISQDPENIQFTDGVHEELINRLAGIGDLTVIARRSVLRFPPGERQDLKTIGDQLGVSSLIDGTVRFSGDRIRVLVSLIDVNTQGTIWSGSFEENIDDVFEIQSGIAQQVAGELHASLTEEEQERLTERPTDNPVAYRFYMQGREYLSRTSFNENNLYAAEKFLNKALDEDPELAQAWGILADTYSRLYWLHGSRPDQLQKLGEAAEWALFYGPDLAETYLANGVYLYWSSTNNEQTLSHFETAIQKFPNQSRLQLMTAMTHRRLGNWEKLIEYLNKSLELDPLNTNIHTEIAYDYWIMRDYDKAVATIGHLMTLEPNSFVAFWFNAWIGLSKDGTLDNFESWWNYIRPSDPAIEASFWWGKYNTLKRDWTEALRGFQNINDEIQSESLSNYVPRKYLMAVTLDRKGNHTQALTYYEQVRDELESLRNKYPHMPRYRATLGKVYARLDEDEKAVHEAKKITDQMIPYIQDGEFRFNFEMQLAEILTWAGQKEQAIKKLEFLLSIPSHIHRNELRLDPIWDPLRDHPRFQQLIAEEDKPYLEGL